MSFPPPNFNIPPPSIVRPTINFNSSIPPPNILFSVPPPNSVPFINSNVPPPPPPNKRPTYRSSSDRNDSRKKYEDSKKTPRLTIEERFSRRTDRFDNKLVRIDSLPNSVF